MNALHEIEELLAAIREKHPDQRETVDRIRALISSLAKKRQVLRPEAGQGRGKAANYAIESVGGTETLTERRSEGSPLRASHHLFSTVVSVIAQAPKPLLFEDLVSEVKAEMPHAADWQIRVVLRSLAKEGLISRDRARYSPTLGTAFAKAAASWWKKLAQQSQQTL